jgi:hypothetical protein
MAAGGRVEGERDVWYETRALGGVQNAPHGGAPKLS